MPSKQIKEFGSGTELEALDLFVFQTATDSITKNVTLKEILESCGIKWTGNPADSDSELKFEVDNAKEVGFYQTHTGSDLPVLLQSGGGSQDGDTWRMLVKNVSDAGVLDIQNENGSFGSVLKMTSQAAAGSITDSEVEAAGKLKSNSIFTTAIDVRRADVTTPQFNVIFDDDSRASISVAQNSHTTFATAETGNMFLDSGGDISLSAEGGNVTMDDGTNTVFDFDVDNVILKIMDDANATDYLSIAVGTNGATTISTVDADDDTANLQITADGTAELAGTTVTLDSGSNIYLAPQAGSHVDVDGTTFDGGDIAHSGDMSITSTGGDLTLKAMSGGETQPYSVVIDGDHIGQGEVVVINCDGLNKGDSTGQGVYVQSESTSNTEWRLVDLRSTEGEADKAILLHLQHYGNVGGINTAHQGHLIKGVNGDEDVVFRVTARGMIYTDAGINVAETGTTDGAYKEAGTIKFSGGDFLGYVAGSTNEWVSLTGGAITSGVVNAGDQYKVAYYPNEDGSTSVDDTSSLYWRNDRLGVNESDPQTDVHLKSDDGPTIRLERNHTGQPIENNDTLGVIEFYGFDEGGVSTDLEGVGAKIVGEASGNWVHGEQENDTQAELQFWTTPGGDDQGLSKRLTIKDSGVIKHEKATHTNIDTVAYSTTPTLDLDASNLHKITLTGNVTGVTLDNPKVGQRFLIRVLQDNGGNHTIVWPSSINWADGGTAPTLTPTDGRATVLGFLTTATSPVAFDGFLIGKNIPT